MSPDPQTSATKPCWVITDGTPGMENQALGLAERLGLPIAVKRVRLRWPWDRLASHMPVSPFGLASPGSDRVEPPWPRVAIGCGRQSIPFMRAIKKASPQTITVQCQHPRVSPRLFDLVVPPEHDGLTGANVLPLTGSPNRVSPAALEKANVGRLSSRRRLESLLAGLTPAAPRWPDSRRPRDRAPPGTRIDRGFS